MACDAAIRHVRRVLDERFLSMNASDVYAEVRWWTPDTIVEALDSLVAARAAIKVEDRYHVLGPLR